MHNVSLRQKYLQYYKAGAAELNRPVQLLYTPYCFFSTGNSRTFFNIFEFICETFDNIYENLFRAIARYFTTNTVITFDLTI